MLQLRPLACRGPHAHLHLRLVPSTPADPILPLQMGKLLLRQLQDLDGKIVG
jgi:hypothetical protein